MHLRLGMLGMSFRTAPVEIRERLAVNGENVLGRAKELQAFGAEEIVFVSTCNRVEVYWAAPATVQVGPKLMQAWEEFIGLPLTERVYRREGLDARMHLFRVASGLDSMVLGEPHILGQLKSAYELAVTHHLTGRTLNKLFQRAFHVGKRVRTETEIATGITSVAGAAVVLADHIFKDLSRCEVMVLGAGKMAESAARHLFARKTAGIYIMNRRLERAQQLAQTLQATAMTWDEGIRRIPAVDILICSAACTEFLLTRSMVDTWRAHRGGRPFFIIDLAVPRSVDPGVHALDNVYLYDVDDLEATLQSQRARKEEAAQLAEKIVLGEALESEKQSGALPWTWEGAHA